jgi:cytochrome c peroxidase
MDDFAEVEEYVDGDATMLSAIGGRTLQKPNTNHVDDFNGIIDFPPAPKLDALNRLIPARATPAELRGEKLFAGTALCASCHSPVTQFTDNTLHDLQVERLYPGRPEGPIRRSRCAASRIPRRIFTTEGC